MGLRQRNGFKEVKVFQQVQRLSTTLVKKNLPLGKDSPSEFYPLHKSKTQHRLSWNCHIQTLEKYESKPQANCNFYRQYILIFLLFSDLWIFLFTVLIVIICVILASRYHSIYAQWNNRLIQYWLLRWLIIHFFTEVVYERNPFSRIWKT